MAWHVATYLTVQLLEFSPAILEWLKSQRVRKWAMMITIGMTIAGIILSTLHQSALGAMFLLAPGKDASALVFAVSAGLLPELEHLRGARHGHRRKHPRRHGSCGTRRTRSSASNLDPLTIGLGKGASVGIYVYFALKLIGVAHDDHWNLLNTPYGHWFLVEMLCFVLLPGLILSLGVKKQSAGIVRLGAFSAVLGDHREQDQRLHDRLQLEPAEPFPPHRSAVAGGCDRPGDRHAAHPDLPVDPEPDAGAAGTSGLYGVSLSH